MKIVIVKPSSLGDVIHALPFLQAFKETWPDAEVDWIISRSLKGILDGNPLISELITIDKDSWKEISHITQTIAQIRELRHRLRQKHYDMAIDLQGLLRSGLITSFTGAATRVGFSDAREGSTFFYNKKVSVPPTIHAVDRCMEVARAIGAGTDKTRFPLHVGDEARIKVRGLLGESNGYVLLVPAARWPSKIWPAEKFAALIQKSDVRWVITGSSSDKKIARQIIEATPGTNVTDLCGDTDLQGLTALVEGATAVVTNDTGPMHIAAALDRPVIAVFGPTDPVKTGPYGWQNNPRLKVVRAKVSCSPCRNRECADFRCMHKINVNTVFEELKEFI